MKREHVELLELSTLRSALRSVVEEIPHDKMERGGAGMMVNKLHLGIWVDPLSVKETDFGREEKKSHPDLINRHNKVSSLSSTTFKRRLM